MATKPGDVIRGIVEAPGFQTLLQTDPDAAMQQLTTQAEEKLKSEHRFGILLATVITLAVVVLAAMGLGVYLMVAMTPPVNIEWLIAFGTTALGALAGILGAKGVPE